MIYSSTGVSKRGNEAQTFLYGFTEGLLTILIFSLEKPLFWVHQKPQYLRKYPSDFQGEQTGAYSGLKYSYTSNKGIVIGLGSTPAEAKTDPWFAIRWYFGWF